MSELAKRLYGGVEYNTALEKGLLNDAALNDPWAIPSIVLKPAYELAKLTPYLSDIWNGKNLFLRKPVSWMDANEINQLSNDAEQFFKEYLVENPVNTILGKVNFRGNRATETRPEYMWLYPFSRYNLSRAKINTPFPNVKPHKKNTEKFDNLKVNFLGKTYDYQIRNNKNDKSRDFYNIKDYKYFIKDLETIKNHPTLYQEFLDMQ